MSGSCFGLQESIFLFWNDAKYSFISICFFQLGSGVNGHLNPDQVLHVLMPKENNVHCTCWLLLMHDEKLPGMITSTLQAWIDYGHSFRFQHIDHQFLNPPKNFVNPNLSPKFFSLLILVFYTRFYGASILLNMFLSMDDDEAAFWSIQRVHTDHHLQIILSTWFIATADSFNRWRCN